MDMMQCKQVSRSAVSRVVLLAAAAVASAPAVAQTAWPSKPVRMIVAFVPGGGTDIVARLLAPRLSDALGQAVVIDNRGGAGGNIGTEAAARAAPDGYTLLMGNVAPNAINVSLAPVPFDPVRDFAPISQVAITPNVLVVHPSLPVKTVKELLAPAATPRGVIDRMHAETVKIIGTPDMREKLIAQGFEPVGSSPAEFAAYIQAQIETWAKVIRAAGLRS